MDDLEEKLIKIHIDIMKDKYYMADFHWQEAKEAFENAEKEGKPITGYYRELGAKIAKVAIDKIEEGAIKICEGHSRPSSKRLDELEKNFQEILASIEALQKQKENIQQQIRQKTSAKKRLESQVNSPDSTPNNSGFNWMYVVVPGGVLLIIMVIVIAYLVGKQSKK